MDPELVEFLTSPVGDSEVRALIGRDVDRLDALSVVSELRRRHDRPVAAAIYETALLRVRAAAKFDDPSSMLFDREALEQATPQAIARRRAETISGVRPGLVVDLGCGIGGDAIELSRVADVVGVDLDPARLRLARHNVRVAGGGFRFDPVRADSLGLAPFRCGVAFADPARRRSGRRLRGLDSYLPPVPALLERWRGHADSIMVKVAPGITDAEIPDGASVEWISLDGDLREATVVVGDLRSESARTATVLPAGLSISGPEPSDLPVTPIGPWILEPDDAVIRAGLVRVLASLVGAALIDPEIAYLTADGPVEHPMLTAYPVDEVMPFNLKRLRRRLAELQVGIVTIKKRGSPLTPEELRRRLRLHGDRSATILLTLVDGSPMVAIGLDRPVTS